MRSVHVLWILLASMLILSAAIIILKDDVLQIDQQPWSSPSRLLIREVDVKPLEVTSAQIEVNVTAYINHEGSKTKNASMLIRAISSDTRLLGTQVSVPIPETESELEKTLAVSTKLKVERNGGYELNILLFDNGSIKDSGTVNIRGLNAIIPQSKRSGIVLNNIDFTIGNVSRERVSIKSDIYLENRGQEASENLKMIVKAREASSNLLADKTNAETGVIISENTIVKSVSLTVPDEYNYMIVVELWKGDILINNWEKPVLLAPTKTVPKESTEKKMDIEVSKFVREPTAAVAAEKSMSPSGTMKAEPGFEIVAGILAVFAVFSLRRRL